MDTQTTHRVRLTAYNAYAPDEATLILGTRESYGAERLLIEASDEWDGLVITATFWLGDTSTRMVVGSDGLVDVPPEATALQTTAGRRGKIVFAGTADDVQRISTNLMYVVLDHAPEDGGGTQPTASEWAQFVAQTGSARAQAVEAAQTAQQRAEACASALAQAQSASLQAVESAALAQQAVNTGGYFFFAVSPEDGYLYETRTEGTQEEMTFSLNERGELEVECG